MTGPRAADGIHPKLVGAQERVILFLQGPNCFFFSRLAERFRAKGHQCLRINLCVADWFFWRGDGAFNFRGSLEEWPQYLETFLERHAVTDLLLLGEQRVYHKAAITLAQERGIRVTVTEWGYLRPGWITLEREGMSGQSQFPRDPEEIRVLSRQVGEPEMRDLYPDDFWRVALHGSLSDCCNWLLHFLFPGYQTHLLANPVKLYLSAGHRIWRSRRRRRETSRQVARLRAESVHGHPYFVFPMQIEMDFQIRAYSHFTGMEEVLRLVIGSFARHAPGDSRLAVKLHPLDPGLRRWDRIVPDLAEEVGVGDRVVYLDGGSFEDLVGGSVGVVTVNSTAGIAALRRERPVKVLGEAVYEVPGLVDPQSLDTFWQAPMPPDMELTDDFIRAVAGCIQVKGGFFSKSGLEAAIEEVACRIQEDRVNRPLGAQRPDRRPVEARVFGVSEAS